MHFAYSSVGFIELVVGGFLQSEQEDLVQMCEGCDEKGSNPSLAALL